MIGKILIIALFCKVSWSLPKSRPRFRWNRIHWEIPRQLDLKSGCVCIYVERYLPDLINRLIDFSELIFCSWTDDYIIKLASERRTRTNLTGKPNEFSLNWMFLCGHNRLRSQSLDNKAGHPFWHKLKIIIKSNSYSLYDIGDPRVGFPLDQVTSIPTFYAKSYECETQSALN